MQDWLRKISPPVIVLVVALVSVTVAIAAYTGPIRPREFEELVGYTRSIYQNNPWTLACSCAYASPGGRCGDDAYGCFCGDPPYNNPALYTCYEDQPRYETIIHYPATVSGSFACGTPGDNGWCRGGASLNVSGSEPVVGYSITAIEGNYDNSNNADVSCGGAACGFTPPQGSGTFYHWAVSSYGDTSAKGSTGFQYDSEAPSTPVIVPDGDLGNNGWYVSDVSLSATSSDATSGLQGVTISPCGTNPCTLTGEGTIAVQAVARDNAGNTSTQNTTVRIDKTPPVASADISGTPGNNGWYRSVVEVSGLAEDVTSGIALVEVDGQPGVSLTDGVHTVTVRAVDNAGNETTRPTTVRVDTTPPNLTPWVSPGASNGWHRSGVMLDAAADDPLSGLADVRVRVDGGAWQSLPLELRDEGVYDVEIEAKDEAGNLTASSLTVRIDQTLPQGGFDALPDLLSGVVELSGDAGDALSGLQTIEISFSMDQWQEIPVTDGHWTYKWDTTQTAGGTQHISLRLTDRAGNVYTTGVDVLVSNAPTETPIPKPPPPSEEKPTATRQVIFILPTATHPPTMTPTATEAVEGREEPTAVPPVVSMVLPTPQPTAAVEPPKEVQEAVETVRRALWPFLTLIGLSVALGYSAMQDERPRAIRKLAKQIEQIINLQEVK